MEIKQDKLFVLKHLALVASISVCGQLFASEYDFHLFFEKPDCKNVVGGLNTQSKYIGVQNNTGDYYMPCIRINDQVRCNIVGDSFAPGHHQDYTIDLESNNFIFMFSEKRGDEILINKGTNSVSSRTRLMIITDDQSGSLLGGKICGGIYVTDAELEEFNNK